MSIWEKIKYQSINNTSNHICYTQNKNVIHCANIIVSFSFRSSFFFLTKNYSIDMISLLLLPELRKKKQVFTDNRWLSSYNPMFPPWTGRHEITGTILRFQLFKIWCVSPVHTSTCLEQGNFNIYTNIQILLIVKIRWPRQVPVHCFVII